MAPTARPKSSSSPPNMNTSWRDLSYQRLQPSREGPRPNSTWDSSEDYMEKIVRINMKIESFCELFICTKSLLVEETGEFSSRQTTKRQFSIVFRTSLQAGSGFFFNNSSEKHRVAFIGKRAVCCQCLCLAPSSALPTPVYPWPSAETSSPPLAALPSPFSAKSFILFWKR